MFDEELRPREKVACPGVDFNSFALLDVLGDLYYESRLQRGGLCSPSRRIAFHSGFALRDRQFDRGRHLNPNAFFVVDEPQQALELGSNVLADISQIIQSHWPLVVILLVEKMHVSIVSVHEFHGSPFEIRFVQPLTTSEGNVGFLFADKVAAAELVQRSSTPC